MNEGGGGSSSAERGRCFDLEHRALLFGTVGMRLLGK